MNPIQETFKSYKYSKKVIVFAEALYMERYDLAGELIKCIPSSRKEVFMGDVELWLTQTYGV